MLSWPRLSAFILVALFSVAFVAAMAPDDALADGSPTQVAADYNPNFDCIGPASWTTDLESHLKETLQGEWQAGWHTDALKAGATIIRQDMWFKHRYPEHIYYPVSGFCNGAPFAYDFSKAYFHGYRLFPQDPNTNSAIDATKTLGWYATGTSANNLELQFGSQLQEDTQTQALAGHRWDKIVGKSTYPPGEYCCDPPPWGSIARTQPPLLQRVYPPLIANCLYNPFGTDSDCDGFTDTRELFLGTDYQGRCGEGVGPDPSSKWPLDFVSAAGSNDRSTLTDLTSFLAPVRHFGTDQGQPGYDKRWDLVANVPDKDISLVDLLSAVAGPTAFPLMFGGVERVFGGPACSNHPDYGD
jgi:hypothetical protein